MRICLSLQISRLFFCNAIRRFYEFQKQTGRKANPTFTIHNGSSPNAVIACINMISAAICQLILLVPCLWIFVEISDISHSWYAFWLLLLSDTISILHLSLRQEHIFFLFHLLPASSDNTICYFFRPVDSNIKYYLFCIYL